jgi:hypothetical protein
MLELSVGFGLRRACGSPGLILGDDCEEGERRVFDGSQCHLFPIVAEQGGFEGVEEGLSIDDPRDHLVRVIGQLDDSGPVLLAGNHSQYFREGRIAAAVDPPFLRKAIEDGVRVVLQLVVGIEGRGNFGIGLEWPPHPQLAPGAGEELLSCGVFEGEVAKDVVQGQCDFVL